MTDESTKPLPEWQCGTAKSEEEYLQCFDRVFAILDDFRAKQQQERLLKQAQDEESC